MTLLNSIDSEMLNQLPTGHFDGEIKVISTEEEALKVIPEIIINKRIGFDTETKPVFKKGEKRNISLLQLSDEDTAWIFRLNKMNLIPELVKILSDPKIEKIGAAILDDIRGLKKISPFIDKGFIDLQKLVAEYDVADKGVKKMAGIFLGFKISKRQRLSNWEATQLSKAQLSYAATDAWVCLEIYNKMLEIKSNKE